MKRLLSPDKVVGIKQTRNAVLQDRAAVVYLAEDAALGMLDEIIELCKDKKIEQVFVPTRRELAKHCKIDVPCAGAAVLNDSNK